MKCRDLLRYWPTALFAVIAIPVLAPEIMTIKEGPATLISGMLSSITTAIVGFIAYRGVIAPIAAQREADRRQVAHVLIADLTKIGGAVLGVLADLERAASLSDPPMPMRLEFTETDRRLQQLEQKLGSLPVLTVLAVSEAYEKIPDARRIERLDTRLSNANALGVREVAWREANGLFRELDAAITHANNALIAFIRHD